MALQMVFGLAGLVWVIAVFPFSRKSKCLTVSDKNLKTPVSPE